MKAVLLMGHGGPEKLEYREDVPVPDLAPAEVLIQVGACGVNNTDLWTREAAYGDASDPESISTWRREPMDFPRIQGSDIVGRIADAGSWVVSSRIGQRVIVDPTLYSGDGEGLYDCGFIGSERDGGFAEYVAVPVDNAHPIHSPLSDEQLATFPVAYVTAEHMLNRARLAAGETVLVTGASGGVGSAVVQLARIRGASVIALAGSGKENRVRALGADPVITRQEENLYQAIVQAVGDRPIDVVADVVAGAEFPTLLEVLRKGGRYVTVGAIAGPVVQMDLRRVYLRHLEIIGSTLGTRQEFATLVRYIESGKLKPLLARSYPLRDMGKAQEDFQTKQFVGKLVLVPM